MAPDCPGLLAAGVGGRSARPIPIRGAAKNRDGRRTPPEAGRSPCVRVCAAACWQDNEAAKWTTDVINIAYYLNNI